MSGLKIHGESVLQSRIRFFTRYQSEDLFLTYSSCQKVDDFLNGVISFAICGLQFAVYREYLVWLSVNELRANGRQTRLWKTTNVAATFNPLSVSR